jgi:rhamnosyltransferase
VASVLQAVFEQETDFPFEVLVIDSGSSEADLQLMGQFPIRLQRIAPSEFGHGTTRNLLASEASGQVLVYLTQDAQPAKRNWLATLVAAVADSDFAGAYSRQVPRDEADPFIRFFLAQTYGPHPIQYGPGRSNGLAAGSILFSNVGSALRRDAWERVPFRDVVMSEDQYWGWDALKAGYMLAYVPAAEVQHSHNYSLPALFRRNWLSGASLRGLLAGSAREAAEVGAKYLAREVRYLLQANAAARLPRMLAYEAVRSAAFWLGLHFGPAAQPD